MALTSPAQTPLDDAPRHRLLPQYSTSHHTKLAQVGNKAIASIILDEFLKDKPNQGILSNISVI